MLCRATPEHAERPETCRPIHPIPVQFWAASQPIVVPMTVNRIRRWPTIDTELGVCPVFAQTATQQTRGIRPMLFQCWASVEDVGPTLKQHWVNASCLLGIRVH